ncbi:unknown [Clostridium sp. CAG:575]|nr:unknown [Clostridium sp. CAG:575]
MEYKLNDKEKSYLKKLIINERIDYIRKSRIFDREVLVDFSDFILKKNTIDKLDNKLFYSEKIIYDFKNFIDSF